MSRTLKAIRVRVYGKVQGVGFRPTVYRIAKKLKILGWIANDSYGVILEIEATEDKLQAFIEKLKASLPPNSKIDRIIKIKISLRNFKNFVIAKSIYDGKIISSIPADLSVCGDCLKEVLSPSNRRYLYPFINCTNCGPRFTIVKELPYDRPKTTMNNFTMCPDCLKEYNNPTDRRFHAQPNACPVCGPMLNLGLNVGVQFIKPAIKTGLINQAPTKNIHNSLNDAISLLKQGKIVAVKSLGGYHLVCDACNDNTINRLRKRKLRPDKPFAVMLPNINAVRDICYVNLKEEEILLSVTKPIVLLRKRDLNDKLMLRNFNVSVDCHSREPKSGIQKCLKLKAGYPIEPSGYDSQVALSDINLISPDNAYLGVMLPYTPLHHLLFAQSDLKALIMTSGNRQDEPICADEIEANERLSKIADGFLHNNRPIHNRCDDSIMQILPDKQKTPVFIRRSRGFVPDPINLSFKPCTLHPAPRTPLPCLGVGAQLKNTFCITVDKNAYLSQYIGDMDNKETLDFYIEAMDRFKKFLNVEPKIIAYDLHPDYLSTIYAKKIVSENKGIKSIAVQHHYAHIASVLAEKRIIKPVIGFAFDGVGLGLDGKIWGGECILWDGLDFKRLAHFQYFPLPGGDKATIEIWRLAASLLTCAEINELPDYIFKKHEFPGIKKMIENKINSPDCCSVGRLFDGIASIIGVRNEVNFEAQAAMQLEALGLDISVKKGYNFSINLQAFPAVINIKELIADIWQDKKRGEKPQIISAKFHYTLAEIVCKLAIHYRHIYEINDIAVSGGVFQNRLLLSIIEKKLYSEKFNVFFNEIVPSNDGGISLGQAWIGSNLI